MSSKRRSPDQPVCFFGRIVLEFFNNSDDEFKERTLVSLAKELRKECNVSCVPVEMHEVANPESGSLALAVTAANHDAAMAMMDKVLKLLDEKAPARIIAEDFEKADIF